MREWILKLNAIDGDAASALRVINHFDTLIDQRATVSAMLRATAALTDCAAGVSDDERGLRLAVDSSGRAVTAQPETGSSRQIECFESVSVWLDRDGEPWPLDRLVLERCARGVHAVATSRQAHPSIAAVEIICDPAAGSDDRALALRHLGLSAEVTVVATRAGDSLPMVTIPALQVDHHQVHLLPGRMPDQSIPDTVSIGFVTCRGTDVHKRWQCAVTALRIAVDCSARPAHIDYATLGGLAAIIDGVDADVAARVPDVISLERLRSQKPWAVSTIDALLGCGSVREVARRQHLHHSTLNDRVEWLERSLGIPLRYSPHHSRLSTAVILWRIATAARTTAEHRQHPHLRVLDERGEASDVMRGR